MSHKTTKRLGVIKFYRHTRNYNSQTGNSCTYKLRPDYEIDDIFEEVFPPPPREPLDIQKMLNMQLNHYLPKQKFIRNISEVKK